MSDSFELTLQELYRITSFDTFLFFALAGLAFADPITDILTMVAFYREQHLTWFIVGLTFVVLPCLMYPFSRRFSIESAKRRDMEAAIANCFKVHPKDFIWGLHPFSPALVKLRVFMLCFNNFQNIRKRRGEYKETEPPSRPKWASENADALLLQNRLDSLFEGLLESAPHIIIQLYAIGSQQEPIKLIQFISLPISVIGLSLSITTLDEMMHDDEIGVLDMKDKLLLAVTQFVLVTSRLLAITVFIVSYQWWIILVLGLHSMSLILVDTIWHHRRNKLTSKAALVAPCFSLLNWLRDDMSLGLYFDAEDHDESTRRQLIRMQWLCNLLFLVENLAMVTLVYFHTQFSLTWFSFPVILYVSLLSYIGATMRYFHFIFLRNRYLKRTSYAMDEDPLSPHDATTLTADREDTNSALIT